jgi:hypothetical protein
MSEHQLDTCNFTEAKWDHTTIWPEGWLPRTPPTPSGEDANLDRLMAHINTEPEYYLDRCTGNDYEKTEAAEFHRNYQESDRDIVLWGLRVANAPAEMIELVESGADISRGDDYRAITEVLTNQWETTQ